MSVLDELEKKLQSNKTELQQLKAEKEELQAKLKKTEESEFIYRDI